MEDDVVRALIKQKVINMKKTKGVTYSFIAKSAGDPVTPYDVAHMVKDDRKLGKEKLDKLKEFMLNY
ncbi:hypothetical protein KM792_11135 [Clostridium tyrobutyricum]|uniref:hypothetical protein n=1 Tax=Clostridium tyrobutyricum TaxID=1519 RepID=UPI001C38FD8D|nr:hypothetical protein [Clostridium tyrobutyricum]MBV4427611.1 hypothetical protein [Clostridium tyrobutyricum]MBV4442652.1 hypothetical protein [Clostridium tyrobutyricum]MBV4450202.1 hypothetical protein [Clostridium tyrobutyricum]MEA5008764.1 hypothetical protein [Clostridium tyrobutyricum]